MSSQENFYVAVRIRPMNRREHEANASNIIEINSQKELVFDPDTGNSSQARHKNLKFIFDHVYDENSTNQEIYKQSIKPLIESFRNGINCSVFAYGATSSGKTYTVFGQEQNGLIYQIIDELFVGQQPGDVFTQQFIEIYNEQLKDLLQTDATTLQIREDVVSGCFVQNAKTVTITTREQAYDNINLAYTQKQTNSTSLNQNSSRSHVLMFLTLKTATFQAKMAVSDLAGSERIAKTNATGVRALEGGSINKSLLSLGNCLQALSSNSGYVPFRNSKLTRLLKFCLTGTAKVCFIAAASPANDSAEETLNTLCYSQRASTIKVKARVNLISVQFTTAELNVMLQEYKEENMALVKELQGLRGASAPQSAQAGDEKEFQQLREQIKALVQEIISSAKEYFDLQKEAKIASIGKQAQVSPQEAQLKSRLTELKNELLLEQQCAEFARQPESNRQYLKLLIENGQGCLAELAQQSYIEYLEVRQYLLSKKAEVSEKQAELLQKEFESLITVAEVCGVQESEIRPSRERLQRILAIQQSSNANEGQRTSDQELTINQLNVNGTQTFNLNSTLPTTSFQPRADIKRALNLQSYRARRVPGLARPAEKKYEEQLGELEKELSQISSGESKVKSRVKHE